jgi:AAA15 family ATPase/GTPase
MITKIDLKNFRCFKDFSLDGIRPVTLISGANNVGKSALLESLFLFYGRHQPIVFESLNGFRGIRQNLALPQMLWESLFADYNTDNDIAVNILNDAEKQTLTLSRDNTYAPKMPIGSQTTHYLMPIGNYSIRVNYKDSERNDIYHYSIINDSIEMDIDKLSKSAVTPMVYLTTRLYYDAVIVAELLGKLEMEGDKSKCIQLLKLLDERIIDLSAISINGIVGTYADIGLPKKLPINMLGDGINKLLHIALTMITIPNGIILIDEIENGFHYSFFPKLWDIIGKLAIETNCQVFATTHSYECICGAKTLATNAASPDLFRFVRLDRKNADIAPKVYENDSFEYAVSNDWEVR